jgi:hypothetical protein
VKRLVLLLALTGCLNRNKNHVAGGVAGALLACDYGQTLEASRSGWADNTEHNMLLGERPSSTKLTAYFAVVALAAAGTVKLPEWARSTLYTEVILFQSAMVLGNRYLADNGSWCGL